MNITGTSQLKAYLTTTGIPFTGSSIQELGGGIANFVWRIRDPSGHSSIIKHAQPYLRRVPSISFSVERMAFEARTLQSLPSVLPPSGIHDLAVRLPQCLHHDEANHVLVTSDDGSRTLKQAYRNPAVDVQGIGRRLGKWLALLHRATRDADIGVDGNAPAKEKMGRYYAELGQALRKYGYEGDLGERVNREFGGLLKTDDECVCHGDFWPGHVLIQDGKDGDGATEAGAADAPGPGPALTVVDWEMVRRGCGATDVGQFAAEAYLLDRWCGGRRLMDSFLDGYIAAAKPDVAFLKRVAIHWGTHIAFWPTLAQREPDEETRELVGIGREVIERVLGEDWEWMGASVVRDIVPVRN